MLTNTSRLEKPDFQIQIHSKRIEGWVSWEHDALFRPTIGVFVDDVLTRVVPTARFQYEAQDGAAVEHCAFDIASLDVAAVLATSSLTIACLETGQILRTIHSSAAASDEGRGAQTNGAARSGARDTLAHASGGLKRMLRRQIASQPHETGDVIDVETVLAAGRQEPRVFGHGGFLRFLSLPLLDQLHILYFDLFDRGADPEGIASFLDRVLADEATILDIRDELLNSREFWERGPFSPDTRIGAWCTWDGLNDVKPALLAGLDPRNPPLTASDGGALRSYVSLASTGHLPRHLARIALGRLAPEQALLDWCRSHFHVICKFDAELDDVPAGAASRKDDRYPLVRNILASVSVGKAGRREGDAIHTQPERSGHLTFGPYLKLPVGTHRISLGYRATIEPGASLPSTLTLEAVAGDVLFGRSDIRIAASTTDTLDLDFIVPATARRLTQDVGFEFRVAVDGRSDIVIESMMFTQNVGEGSTARYPAVASWLDAMSVGAMATRTASGEVECPAKASSGFVVFGPYVKLLPGQYRLIVRITGDLPGRFAKALGIEITEPTGVVASASLPVSLGANEAVLPFTVAPAASLAALRGPFEFRVRSETGIGFRVSDILVEAQ